MSKPFLRLSLTIIVLITYALLNVGSAGRALAQDTKTLFPIEQNGQWGYIDAKGNIVISPQFGDASPFYDTGIAPVKMDGKWGFIDKTGKVVVPPIFTNGPNFSEDSLPSFDFEKNTVSYQDATTKLLTVFQPPATTFVLGQYDTAHPVENSHLFAVARDKKWGFVDQSGKLVVDLQYDSAFPWFEEQLLVVSLKGLYGFIDAIGKTITPTEFQSLHPFSEGLAAVQLKGQWGYIDKSGAFVIAPTLSSDRYFREGLAAVKVNDKWGFMNPAGTVVIQPTFNNVSDFQDGAAWAATPTKWGMIDPQGKFVIEPKFDTNIPPDDNLFFSYGYTTIPYPFTDDAAPIRFGSLGQYLPFGLAGLIDRTGKFLLQPEYANVRYAGAKIFAFEKDEKWGLVDHLGNIIIQPTFEDYSHDAPGCQITFSSDRACVRLGGKYGFIDHTGAVVIQPKYDTVRVFAGGLSQVYIKQANAYLMGYIDLNGNEVWPPSA